MHDRREFALAALAFAGLAFADDKKPRAALGDLLAARFGEVLDAKALASVRKRLGGAPAQADAVRRMKLDWQDDPFSE